MNQKIAIILRRDVSTRSKHHPVVTHIKRDESENDAKVIPMIIICDVEPREYVLVCGRIGTVLAAFCSFGVREAVTGNRMKGPMYLLHVSNPSVG